ncbi:MAG: conserved hypothetical protein [Candidatus Desulfovibrio kirbyi]|uniref:Uncharacterized protein n=1 Tax=Candidatus Desulfovibrio kirbyi TaxID=2696086 RepID=A0A6L2R5L6_9BACT|nr:MAG: conserved hypothetical protein [Candidatus Desulfovibrio kirbyi]
MFPHPDAIPSCADARRRQRLAGRISAIFLLVAALGLVDTLQGVMRAGSDTLEILSGQSVMLSGPTATKNPVSSDLLVSLTPDNGLLRFVFEGFFPSYWFGSGMWRGDVQVDAFCPPGTYELTLRFKGASARSAQKIFVTVWDNEEDMRSGSLFMMQHLAGTHPFLPACVFAVFALACGIVTYFAGKRYFVLLAGMDCAEIFRISAEDDGLLLWCPADKKFAQSPGATRALLHPDGRIIGYALVKEQSKSALILHADAATPVNTDSLVYLRPLNLIAGTATTEVPTVQTN